MRRRPGLPTVALMLAAAHPLITLALAAAGVAAWRWGLEGLVLGGVGLLTQAVFVLWQSERGLPGPAVTPAGQPELAGLVKTVAERVGFAEPIAVCLLPVPEAALSRTRLHGARVVVLKLGYPMVRLFSEAQLAAVVAHELGHRRHMDDWRSTWVLRMRQVLAERVGDGATLPRLLGRGLLRRTQPVSFAFETECDEHAARAVGSEAVKGALLESEVLFAGFHGVAERWVQQLEDDGTRPLDLLEALEALVADPAFRQEALAVPPPVDELDSHPGVDARQRALPISPAGPFADRPVILRDAEALSVRLQEDLFDPELTGIRILDDPERVALREEHARDLARDVSGTGDLAGILDALDRGLPDLDEVDRWVLAYASARLLSAELMRRGWTKVTPWLASTLLDPSGSEHKLRELMRDAISSPEARARVRQLVAS